MLGMRLSDGVNIADFEKRFGKGFEQTFGQQFRKYAPIYVSIDEKTCRFTDKGMFVSNYVLSDVLNF